MKKELFDLLVWYYHNDREQFDKWAKYTEDMWPLRALSDSERKQRSRLLKKEGVYAGKEEVFEEICTYLRQNDYRKLMILFGMSQS